MHCSTWQRRPSYDLDILPYLTQLKPSAAGLLLFFCGNFVLDLKCNLCGLCNGSTAVDSRLLSCKALSHGRSPFGIVLLQCNPPLPIMERGKPWSLVSGIFRGFLLNSLVLEMNIGIVLRKRIHHFAAIALDREQSFAYLNQTTT